MDPIRGPNSEHGNITHDSSAPRSREQKQTAIENAMDAWIEAYSKIHTAEDLDQARRYLQRRVVRRLTDAPDNIRVTMKRNRGENPLLPGYRSIAVNILKGIDYMGVEIQELQPRCLPSVRRTIEITVT